MLESKQNLHRFADNIFKSISLHENYCRFILISLKFVL